MDNTDNEIQIGQRVRSFRLERGMTLKELAAKANITPSMLSQIESGQANPSLMTIRLLAKALNEPIFRLFIEENVIKSEVIRAGAHRKITKNGTDIEMLVPDLRGDIELIRETLYPGGATASEPLGHKSEEVVLVASGSVELTIENDSFILHAGDTVRIKSELRHRWFNNSNEPVVMISAITPPNF